MLDKSISEMLRGFCLYDNILQIRSVMRNTGVGVSGFEKKHFKPVNSLTLMVKLLILTLAGDRMVKNS